jgi:1-acyl-sn-glycerol-3-phosphate acyltransferase
MLKQFGVSNDDPRELECAALSVLADRQGRHHMLIIARLHTSLLDGPAVALWLTRERHLKHCLFAVDPDYARHPVYSALLKVYGWLAGRHTMLPLDNRHPFALRKILYALAAGQHVVIFPQGTGLSVADRPDQPGMGWLLRKAGGKTTVISLDMRHDRRWPSVAITSPAVVSHAPANRSSVAITR